MRDKTSIASLRVFEFGLCASFPALLALDGFGFRGVFAIAVSLIVGVQEILCPLPPKLPVAKMELMRVGNIIISFHKHHVML